MDEPPAHVAFDIFILTSFGSHGRAYCARSCARALDDDVDESRQRYQILSLYLAKLMFIKKSAFQQCCTRIFECLTRKSPSIKDLLASARRGQRENDNAGKRLTRHSRISSDNKVQAPSNDILSTLIKSIDSWLEVTPFQQKVSLQEPCSDCRI